MSKRYASVNGRIVPVDEVSISIFDRGFLYGDGVFETIRVRNSKCIRLNRHVDRLRNGLRVLGIAESFLDVDVEAAILELLEANRQTDARIRLTITRGEGQPGKIGASNIIPTIIVTSDDLIDSPPEPASVIVASIRRDENNPLSFIKSLNYLPSVLARIEAEHAGFDDALLLNTRGRLSDGTVGNVFLVQGEKLITPALSEGPLPGTVRAAVIEIVRELGLEVVETAVGLRDIAETEEAFYTNAIQLVRPICSILDTRLGNGKHPVSARIREALIALEE